MEEVVKMASTAPKAPCMKRNGCSKHFDIGLSVMVQQRMVREGRSILMDKAEDESGIDHGKALVEETEASTLHKSKMAS